MSFIKLSCQPRFKPRRMCTAVPLAVQFDGDGQHSAAHLEEMAKTLVDQNADMVIGSRFITNEGFQSSAMRRL